jgi:succinate dehydrogenase / fumarate reductase cytochrome b subunit
MWIARTSDCSATNCGQFSGAYDRETPMTDTPARQRPISPHLTIYRLTWTMAMSIVHRITGSALYFGTLLLAWWLVAAATGAKYFDTANAFFGSWFGQLILLGYTWALVHHMLGGIRHFIWDTGRGYGPERQGLARMTLIGSVSITILLWALALVLRS